MTTRFTVDILRIETSGGPVTYTFSSALTVLAGPVGVGKSTLIELMKYALGGDAMLASVVRSDVLDVAVDVRVGKERLRLARSTDRKKSKTVRVTDLITTERLPDRSVSGDDETSLSHLLLTNLSLPTDVRAASRKEGTRNGGARITFSDIFNYMYVPQSDIARVIAHSEENYREPKRKAVFELLFRLTDANLLKARSRLASITSEHLQAKNDHAVVLGFLQDSNTASRIEATLEMESLRLVIAEAERYLTQFHDGDIIDDESAVLRDLLEDAEQRLSDAKARLQAMLRENDALVSRRRATQLELEKLHKLNIAADHIARIEFTSCPRCLQSVARDVGYGICRLCLQEEPASSDVFSENDSTKQNLISQLAEYDAQSLATAEALSASGAAIEHGEALVQKLSQQLDKRTAERVTPRLQAYADASRRIAQAEARISAIENVLTYWDREGDISASVENMRREKESIASQIETLEIDLANRRTSVLEQLSEEFSETINFLGVPGVTSASINPSKYLPELNGEPYARFSPPGGIRTVVQVAYWITLMTVSLRLRDTLYPAFLLIDSPRTALNNSEDLAERVYRRLVRQVDFGDGRLQIIVADNELPKEYRRQYEEIDFTYDEPTIAGIPHPGPDAVETLDQ